MIIDESFERFNGDVELRAKVSQILCCCVYSGMLLICSYYFAILCH